MFKKWLDPEDPDTYLRLRLFNLVMGVFHLIQAGIMFAISNDTAYNLTTRFFSATIVGDEFIPSIVTEEIASIQLGPAIALFLLLSAVAHFLIATPGIYEWYRENLKKGINVARWIEYSFSSSIMLVVIAILSGMFDAPSLLLLFTLNATMIWFGHLMELHNQTTEKTNWISFIYGSVAGFVPWIVIGWYFFAALNNITAPELEGEIPPTFVYFILGSLFVFFNTFAINMFLQYKKIGPWKNYLFGEAMYIILSLVAKSALAWQVFAGTLR